MDNSDPDMKRTLHELAQPALSPDGESYRSLNMAATDALARRFSLSRREAEIFALEAGVIPERYQRNIGTVGVAGQIRLLNSRAGIVGAGGLGGLAVELLARMGVGSLVVVDGDVFTESNLNRQILSAEDSLGQAKAEAAAVRAAAVNGAVEIAACSVLGDAANLPQILCGCGVVLDCLDNLPSRFALEQVCQDLGVPLVHGAIAGFLGQVTVIWPGEPVLDTIYSPPGKGTPDHGVEVHLGNPSATPAMVASWQAGEAVKVLAGLEGVLRGRLLIMDMAGGTIASVQLSS